MKRLNRQTVILFTHTHIYILFTWERIKNLYERKEKGRSVAALVKVRYKKTTNIADQFS